MTEWLTIEEAAKRLGKSTDTVYRWAREGLITIVGQRVLETQLLAADRTKRQRVGRPRATRSNPT